MVRKNFGKHQIKMYEAKLILFSNRIFKFEDVEKPLSLRVKICNIIKKELFKTFTK